MRQQPGDLRIRKTEARGGVGRAQFFAGVGGEIDDHHAAAGFHDAEGLADGAAADVGGLLVQEEKQQGPVVGGVGQREIGGVLFEQAHGGGGGKFFAEVVELDGQDIHHIEAAALMSDARGEAGGEIAIDASDLQGAAVARRAEGGQCGGG